MVSSSLLMIGLAATFSSFSTMTQLVAHNRRVDLAMHLAQQTAEELISLTRDHALLQDGPHTGPCFDNDALLIDCGDLKDDGFRLQWRVGPYKPMDGMSEIQLSARFGAKGTVNLTTYRERVNVKKDGAP
jgi:hypothetical protein